MTYAIANQLFMDIKFNGLSFPFDHQSDLIFLHLTEGAEQVGPYLSLSLRDNGRWLAQNKVLTVGTSIEVRYFVGSPDGAAAAHYTFTLTASSVQEKMGAIDYRIDAILFAPAYMSGVVTQGIKGSSSYVLKTLAESVDFTFDGIGTSDTMVWHASGKPVYKFVRYVADHGFTTESGCMAIALTADRILRYRDITAMDGAVAVLGLQSFGRNDVELVTSIAPQEVSGSANVVSGNGMNGVEHWVDGEVLHVKHKAVSTQVNEEGALTIDRTAKGKVTSGKTIHYPITASDMVHVDFHRAAYQNARVSMLFNSRVDVVLPQLTRIRPLDTVTLDTSIGALNAGAGLTRHSGTYRVLHKVTYVLPGQLRVKLTLIRRTSDAGQEVVAPPPQVRSSSALTGLNDSLIVNPGLLRDKVPRLPAMSDMVPADLLANASYIATAAVATGGTILALSTAARALMQSTQTAAETGSQFKPLLDALIAEMTALTTTAQTDITAIRTPAGSTITTLPLMEARYTTYTTAVEAAITAATPGIRSEANKAIELASIGQDVASSSDDSAGMAAAQSAAGQLGAAMGAASGSAGAATANAAQQATLSASLTTQTAATSAQTSATSAAMTTLHNEASNWQQVITDAKTTRFTATRAIVDAP